MMKLKPTQWLTLLLLALTILWLITILIAAAKDINNQIYQLKEQNTTQNSNMWHCDGWEGKMYPTERSMRRAFK